MAAAIVSSLSAPRQAGAGVKSPLYQLTEFDPAHVAQQYAQLF